MLPSWQDLIFFPVLNGSLKIESLSEDLANRTLTRWLHPPVFSESQDCGRKPFRMTNS